MKTPPNNTALQTFMRSLLLDHSTKTGGRGGGDFILVVDNASSSAMVGKPLLPDHHPQGNIIPMIIGYDSGCSHNNSSGSNHSANRWLTDEKFPTRETMKRIHTTTTSSNASTTAFAADSSPSTTTTATATNLVSTVDAPTTPLRGHNRTNSDQNSGPTFPVRKLSPQAHREDESGTVSPSSVFQLYYEAQPQEQIHPPSQLRRVARVASSTARPPLSPRKNSLALRQPHDDSSVFSKKEKPSETTKNKYTHQPPTIPTSSCSSLQQNNPNQKPILPSLWIGNHEEQDEDEEDSSSSSMYLHDSFDSGTMVDRVKTTTPPPRTLPPAPGLIRGLSAVLGADIPISPPVAPIRRESAQVYPDNDDYNSSSQSFLDDDDNDEESSMDQDDLYMALYHGSSHEKQLLEQSFPHQHRYSNSSASSMIVLAGGLNAPNYLDVCYSSTEIPTGHASTTLTTSSSATTQKKRRPDTDDDVPPSLQPPMRLKQ